MARKKKAAPPTVYLEPELIEELQNRLSRVEGHVRGVKRMLEDKAACEDLLIQTSAIRAAVNQITIRILEGHMECWVAEWAESGDGAQALERLQAAMSNVLKRM